MTILQDFKKFLLRGNLVELAVAFIIGVVFAALVKAFIAAVAFFFVVRPYNALIARRAKEDPDTKECPECTSAIPIKARRCPQCTAQLAGTA